MARLRGRHNSLRHGGGRGTLRIWRDTGALVNQLCDLIQLRSFPDGAAVRMHMCLP